AGLAITPAPLAVIPVAIVSGRVASRHGHRVLIGPGGVIFSLAGLLLVLLAGSEPTYASVWLPASILVGLGVGLCLPVLSSAAVHGLPPTRFAIGSAVNQALRQLGGVLGVALAVALLGRDFRSAPLSSFNHVRALFIAGGLLTSVASLGVRTKFGTHAR